MQVLWHVTTFYTLIRYHIKACKVGAWLALQPPHATPFLCLFARWTPSLLLSCKRLVSCLCCPQAMMHARMRARVEAMQSSLDLGTASIRDSMLAA